MIAAEYESSKQIARLVNLVAQQHTQLQNLTLDVQRLTELSQSMSKKLSEFKSSDRVSPAHNIAAIFQPIRPGASTSTDSGNATTPVPRIAMLPTSLKGMRASFLFMEFYSNRWYALPLIAAECTLTLPPAAGDERFREWQVNLDHHARAAERAMLEYIVQIKPNATKRERAFRQYSIGLVTIFALPGLSSFWLARLVHS